MEKRNVIRITKEDIIRWLKADGVETPSEVYVNDSYMNMDEDGMNVEISWTETIRPKIKHPDDALLDFPLIAAESIKQAMENGDRLAAIKIVRAQGSFTLMSAKEWIMKHYPV